MRKELTEQEDQMLDSYLRGKLNKADSNQVENQLQTNADWQAAFAFRQSVRKVAAQSMREELRARFTAVDKRLDVPPSSSISIKKRYRWLVAAMITFLLVGGIWYMQQPSTAAKLFTTYYKPLPNLLAPIRKGNDTTTLTETDIALQSYERHQYSKAVEQFYLLEQQETSRILSNDLQLYYALALLETNATEAAIVKLITITQDHATEFQPTAEWYLALAYLKNSELEKARQQLQTITTIADHRYRAIAEDLLNDL